MCDTQILFSKLWYLSIWTLVVYCNEGFARDFSTWVAIESARLSDALTYFNSMQYFSVSNCDQLIQRNCNGHAPRNAHKRSSGMAAFFLAYAKRTVFFYVTNGFVWLIIAKLWIYLGWLLVSLHIIDQSSLWYFCHVELFFLIETMYQILNAYSVDTYIWSWSMAYTAFRLFFGGCRCN